MPVTPAGADGSDRITNTAYNPASQVLTVTSGWGVAPQQDAVYFYNTNGTTSGVADNYGNLTSYTYDAFNRPLKTCYPATTVMTSSTTDCDQVTYTGARVTGLQPRGFATASTVTYDLIGRVTQKSAVSGQVPAETFAYDSFSQVTLHHMNGYNEYYSYDPLDGLLSDSQPMGIVYYDYDVYGRRAKLTYPPTGTNAFYVAYSYRDDNSLIAEKVSYAGGAETTQAQFAQDNFARLSSLAYGPSSVVTMTPTYNATTFRMDSLASNLSGTTNDATWNLSYVNPTSQLSGRTLTGPTTYNYTAANNVATYALNTLNQIGSATVNSVTKTFAYGSGRANLTSDGVTTYAYNGYNLLTTVTGGYTLNYDANNRLLKYITPSATTQFLYDGTDIIAEYDASSVLQRRYVPGPGTDNPLVWYEGTDVATARYMTVDQLGSVTAVTDSTGAALAINAYDEYGQPSTTSATYEGKFRYTGQVWLKDIGLYYYKARIYNPKLGRFMQPDPIGYGNGLNLYAYVHADPVNLRDPLGQADHCVQYTVNYHYTDDPDTEYHAPAGIECFADEAAKYFQNQMDNGRRAALAQVGQGLSSILRMIKAAGKSQRDALCDADFYTGSVSFGEIAQGTTTVTADKFGHVYWSIGLGGAAPKPAGGFSFGAYKMIQSGGYYGPMNEEQINGFVTGWGITANAVLGGGGSFSANTSGSAYGLLVGTPSLDISGSWTKDVTDFLKINPNEFMKSLNSACGR